MLSLAAFGCAQAHYYPTGGAKSRPRDANCQFQVLASQPGPGYTELGQVDFSGGGMVTDPRGAPHTFADAVREKVCAAGGDALVTQVNGQGDIVRGVVFRKADAAAAPPPAASAGATAAGECEPICSPGFRCASGACVPQCNPACSAAEACGNDRLCHPK